MIALLLYRTVADTVLPWLVQFATRMLARSLNMPEPLLHSAGDFVVTRVLAFEQSVGKTFNKSLNNSLCPFRLGCRLRARWRSLRNFHPREP